MLAFDLLRYMLKAPAGVLKERSYVAPDEGFEPVGAHTRAGVAVGFWYVSGAVVVVIALSVRGGGASAVGPATPPAIDEPAQQILPIGPALDEVLVGLQAGKRTLLQLGRDDGRNFPRDDPLAGAPDRMGTRVGPLLDNPAHG